MLQAVSIKGCKPEEGLQLLQALLGSSLSPGASRALELAREGARQAFFAADGVRKVAALLPASSGKFAAAFSILTTLQTRAAFAAACSLQLPAGAWAATCSAQEHFGQPEGWLHTAGSMLTHQMCCPCRPAVSGGSHSSDLGCSLHQA